MSSSISNTAKRIREQIKAGSFPLRLHPIIAKLVDAETKLALKKWALRRHTKTQP